jgi:hypothetical protein
MTGALDRLLTEREP